MPTFVSYDVQQSHTAFKQNLFKQGFYNCIVMNSGPNKVLPNTNVAIDENDLNIVERKFNAALAATTPNPGLEKVAFVPYGGAFRLNSNQNCQ